MLMMLSFVATGALWGAPVRAAGSASTRQGAEPTGTVPFVTIAVVSDTSGINLTESVAIPVRTADDLADLSRLLSAGTDGAFAGRIVAAAEKVPDDRLALVGLIDSSCNPPSEAGLRRESDSNVSMFAVEPVPNQVDCFIAVETVAVLAVEPADVPLGATDSADLVAFERTGDLSPGATSAVELTDDDAAIAAILAPGAVPPVLPPIDKGTRRFAFVRAGCQESTAELLVTRRFVDVRLYNEPVEMVIACAHAEFFLAVFDVRSDLVWPDATIGAY